VHHKYNSVVAENFVGDEFFGADRKRGMKTRMRAYVKEVHKLSADVKKAVGVLGGPSYGAGKRNRKRGNRAGPSGSDRSFLHALSSQLLTSLESNSGRSKK
jgi:hypothetical protein